jgi:O-antigen/teichoic acid export membrane protein
MSVIDRPLSAAVAPAAQAPSVRRTRGRALASGGAMVFGSTLAWHASNFAFNSATARILGPAGYGELAAIVAILYLASPLLVSVQTVASRTATGLVVAGHDNRIRGELRLYGRRLFFVGLVAAALLALGSSALARFLRVSDGRPIAILGFALALSVVTHLQRGVMQGTTRFGRYAVSTLSEALAKVALAVALAWMWRSVDGPVLGVVAAAGCGLVVNAVLLRFLPKGDEAGSRDAALPAGSAATVATFLLLSLLLSVDVLAAKRYLPAAESGLYAAVSLSGKVVFFATSAVSLYLFPSFSAERERNADGRRTLEWALAAVGGCSAVIATAYFTAPSLVVRPLFGARYDAAGPYLGWIAIAFGGYGVAYLCATYLLARGRWAGPVVLVVAAVAQLGALYALHTTIARIVAVQVAVLGTAAVVLMLVCLRRPVRESGA